MRKSEFERLKEILSNQKVPKPEKTYYTIIQEPSQPSSTMKVRQLIKNVQSVEPIIKDTKTFQNILSTIQKAQKLFVQNFSAILNNQKKISTICAREMRRALSKTSKTNPTLKAKKINKELTKHLARMQRDVKDKIKKEDAAAEIKKKQEIAQKEELRQKRKFAYLMSQTEAFANFVLRKKSVEEIVDGDSSEKLKVDGIKAAKDHLSNIKEFDEASKKHKNTENENKGEYEYKEVEQPKVLQTTLKPYQLKGLNWLVNLYNQGINGILADDMGLGKTVQAISFLGYLYETEDIFGPFLVITPASTLHNWENEFRKFIPDFKVVNYYGNIQERTEIRKKFKKSNVIVTSYQVAVMDEMYLKKISWQYMILDEAQAIKSMNSQRWNTLLAFKSRNRCLLTGTPIQNNLQELWSLLHFIMPTLFDSLSEFSEWFLTENKVDENQISKLHTILKPFMLRRHKTDIKDEIGTKEIINIYCNMSPIQRVIYDDVLKNKVCIKDGSLTNIKSDSKQREYENKIMQLKKICNHPDLFEKQEPRACFNLSVDGDSNLIGPSDPFSTFINYDNDLFKESKNTSIANMIINQMKYEYKIKTEKIKHFVLNKFESKEKSYIFDDIKRINESYENNLNRFSFVKEKVMNPYLDEKMKQNNSFFDKMMTIPPINDFVNKSGKLFELDLLLKKLKAEDHRALVYFQMTKMMDLFEDYLIKMEYSYLRLDGSSKITLRADLVNEWQNKDIFIFILSTRAGGVGINLTAADTVIFYDSDWNPTVDQQAMDRVHRLGQTKNVTVYRLVTKSSIEETVMERAAAKDEMQKIVIKGGVFKGL